METKIICQIIGGIIVIGVPVFFGMLPYILEKPSDRRE